MSPTSKMATRSFYFLSFIALTVQIEPELKQRHSDSLCKIGSSHQVRHQTSGCYSWLPGHQCSCLLKFAIADRTQWNRLWSRPLSSFGNFVLRISVFCSLWKVGIYNWCMWPGQVIDRQLTHFLFPVKIFMLCGFWCGQLKFIKDQCTVSFSFSTLTSCSSLPHRHSWDFQSPVPNPWERILP